MEITREYNEREDCYHFYLQEGNKVLKIIFGGNLDLYWNIFEFSERDKDLTQEELKKEIYGERKYTFTITKENYFIYSLFEELYDDIKKSRIFIPTVKKEEQDIKKDLDEDFDFWKELDETEINKRNRWYKERDIYQLLFDGENIEWHSDDDMYDRADRVIIKKAEDTFILEFTRPAITDDNFIYRLGGSISIRFRNSGSIYDPYNIIFMRMFNNLQEYNPEYHQIHLEELSHQKKLTLKK